MNQVSESLAWSDPCQQPMANMARLGSTQKTTPRPQLAWTYVETGSLPQLVPCAGKYPMAVVERSRVSRSRETTEQFLLAAVKARWLGPRMGRRSLCASGPSRLWLIRHLWLTARSCQPNLESVKSSLQECADCRSAGPRLPCACRAEERPFRLELGLPVHSFFFF